ncbi:MULTISPECIES: nucleotidyl transferase AbiEii/AbiGii toxin family protein [unclassified Mesorhizobium]|uniref:nucleotidyl transferase AbiEii/AbiGii toxin family protein n=1 Tax=unclassified Mesorhizobium TaxID=325217 RepID=UPI003336B353
MIEVHSRRPSEWRRLFALAADLIDQLRKKAGGFEFEWSFGGGTAMMIQINHRESHDVDIFLDDPQLLGFIDQEPTGRALPVAGRATWPY